MTIIKLRRFNLFYFRFLVSRRNKINPPPVTNWKRIDDGLKLECIYKGTPSLWLGGKLSEGSLPVRL